MHVLLPVVIFAVILGFAGTSNASFIRTTLRVFFAPVALAPSLRSLPCCTTDHEIHTLLRTSDLADTAYRRASSRRIIADHLIRT